MSSHNIQVVQVHQGKYVNLYHLTTEINGEKFGPYEMASRRNNQPDNLLVVKGNELSDAVVVIATTKEGKLVVTKEYRYPIGKWIYGFPAGCREKNQTVFQCAQNELQQECGLIVMPDDVIRMRHKTLPSAGLTDETITLVWCQASGIPNNHGLEHGEHIETFLMGVEDLRKLLDSDEWVANHLAVTAHLYIMMHDHLQHMQLLAS